MNRDEFLATRRSLVDRLANWNDQKNWQEFFNTYGKLIFSVARKSGLTETEAEDVVQETVLTVAKKVDQLKYDPAVDSFKGWLLKVTRWRILDQLERRKRSQSLCTSAATVEGEGTRTATIERVPDPAGFDPATIWDEARIKRQVRPEQYEIYHLHVILERPVREVRRTLGVSAGQVYLAKHRVGALLKKEIRRLEKQMR